MTGSLKNGEFRVVSEDEGGVLYVVATPIGNLQDITHRALSVLQEVELVAAEDTRRAQKLFKRYGINNKLKSYHDHNKENVTPHLMKHLQNGSDIALISEAGTPAISDPGFYLVRQARQARIEVLTIPGPSAAVAALSISGLPTDAYFFAGFPPRGEKLHQFLQEVALLDCSLVFYESPKRLIRTLEAIDEVLGKRLISISREMTKMYEETVCAFPLELADKFRSGEIELRGEFSLVVAPVDFRIISTDQEPLEDFPPLIRRSDKNHDIGQEVFKQIELLCDSGYRISEAVRTVARGHDLPRSTVYDAFIKYSD